MSLTISPQALFICQKMTAAGYDIHIVGGAVRDLLLNAQPKTTQTTGFDYDFTTNATPEQIQAVFPTSFYENDFGTVALTESDVQQAMGWPDVSATTQPQTNKVIDLATATKIHPSLPTKSSHHQPTSPELKSPNYEITTYRSQEVYANFRQPASLEWGQTLADDLQRRDFTINAMAITITDQALLNQDLTNHQSTEPIFLETSQYQLVDPYHGQADLEAQLIKTVGPAETRFQEDALRMLRALRFSVQLNFSIDTATLAAITQLHELITHISWERIRDEFLKILGSSYPAEGIELLDQTQLLDHILPELQAGKRVKQGGHHTTDVWTHSLDALDNCPSSDPIVRLATLLHDIAKPQTYQEIDGAITFYNHEVIGARVAKQIAQRLRLSKAQQDKIFILVRYHMFYYQPENTDASIRRFMRKVGLDNINDILDLREADRLGSGARKTSWRLEEMKQRMVEQLHQPFAVTDLAINGHDLMQHFSLKPGPQIGQILNQLFEKVLEKPELNTSEQLLKEAQGLLQS